MTTQKSNAVHSSFTVKPLTLAPLTVAIATILSSTALYAAGTSTSETIVVTGEAIDVHVQQQIDAEQLSNRQASDIKDVLNTLPSVTVDGGQRYGRKVWIRGLEDKFSLVTIDGARQEGQIFHHSGDQTIDPELLKRAVIEFGPNSALDSGGTVTGSFRYETRAPSDLLRAGERAGGFVKAGYQDAYHRKTSSAAVFGKLGDASELLLYGHMDDDGTMRLGDGTDIQSKQGKLKSGMAKAVFELTPYSKLKLNAQHYEDGGNRQISGEKAGATEDYDYGYSGMTRNTYSSELRVSPPNSALDMTLNIYQTNQGIDRDAEVSQEKGSQKHAPNRSYYNKTTGADLRNSTTISNHQLTYGMETYRTVQTKKADGVSRYVGGAQDGKIVQEDVKGRGLMTSYGVYAEDKMALGNLTLTPGLRYDQIKMGGLYEGDFNQWSPKLKSSYRLTDNLSVRSGYGRIFKGPGLPETFMISDNMVKPKDVKAQTGYNIEVGADYDLTRLVGADYATSGFTVYRYTLDNYLHPTKNTALVSQGDADVWGSELNANAGFGRLDLYANYSYSDGTLTDHQGMKSVLPQTRYHSIKLGGAYALTESVIVGTDMRFTPNNAYIQHERNKQGGVDTLRVERDGFSVVNLWTSYEPQQINGLKLMAGIDNLFDTAYAEPTGFGFYWGSPESGTLEPGRNLKLSASYQF
ncbi:MAG: TonB-dependent receptor domain-containing protein [Plesiomonas sp.]|uniref:TonB-dependent receptor domain-containing protein n=1 Tax=Plesiomonas sp. TaxID=2486279 RepID=UPI003F311BD8